MATITGDTETNSYIQLLLDTKDAIKNAPTKLISYAQWLIVTFKLTLKTSVYLAFGTPRLGIMSYLTGNNKLLNTFRRQSNTKPTSYQARNQDTGHRNYTDQNDAFNSWFDAEDQKVEREAQDLGGKSTFKPDGERTRYQKLSGNRAPNTEAAPSMRPQPLQKRIAGRDMAAPEEKVESFADALKDTEAIAILHEEQQLAEAAAHKAALEAAEKMKAANEAPLLGSLRRKISSTFVKDASEQPKSSDQLVTSSPQSVGSFFRKASYNKPNSRDGESLQSISEVDTYSARIETANSGPSAHREEQLIGCTPYELSYSSSHASNSIMASKASVSRTPLSVDTLQAKNTTDASVQGSSATKKLSSKDTKSFKIISPIMAMLPSAFSSASTKPKPRKFSNNDPVVKAIEQQALRDDFGVNKTLELTPAYVKATRASNAVYGRDHSNSLASTAVAAADAFHSRHYSESTGHASTPFATEPAHARNESDISFGNSSSVLRSNTNPHTSFESTVSTIDTVGSQGSYAVSSAPRASGDASKSTTTPGTPETPDAGGSLRIRRKEIGSGTNQSISIGTHASPGTSLGRVAGMRAKLMENDPPGFAQHPVRPGLERSFTDPYNGQAAISSIVRAVRNAFLNVNTQSAADSDKSFSKQHSPSAHATAFTAHDASLVPRPLELASGRSLQPILDTTVSSPCSVPRHLQPLSFIGRDSRGRHPGSEVRPASDLSQVATIQTVRAIGPPPPRPPRPNYEAIMQNFVDFFDPGGPSNRMEHENNADKDRRLMKMSREDYAAYRVAMLRAKTDSEVILYNKHDQYPQHPHHPRRFHSKNLRCVYCTPFCAVCNAPCCAFQGAVYTMTNVNATLDQKAEAITLQKEIVIWTPTTGLDPQSFMECTECRKLVCPDCTSVCPVYPCFDRLCVNCNPNNFWKPCNFHTQADVEMSNQRWRDQLGDFF